MSRGPFVYCQRADRLGARLNNLLCAMEFNRRVGGELAINWPPSGVTLGPDQFGDDGGSYRFFDLFDDDSFRLHHGYARVTHLPAETFAQPLIEGNAVTLSQAPPRPIKDFKTPGSARVYYDLTSPYHFSDHAGPYGQLRPLFLNLRLNSTVRAALREVTSQLPVKDALSLHVRRGDIMAMAHGNLEHPRPIDEYVRRQAMHFSSKYAPYDAYRDFIDRHGGSRPIIVLSDNPEAKTCFEHDYAGRFLDHDRILDRFDLTTHQRDFIEFLLIFLSHDSVGGMSAFIWLARALAEKKSKLIHAFIPVEALIRDLDALTGKTPSGRELRDYVLEEYAKRFASRGLATQLQGVQAELSRRRLEAVAKRPT